MLGCGTLDLLNETVRMRHDKAMHIIPLVDAAFEMNKLGHSSINTTAVYLRFNNQDLQDVYHNVPF
jgi:site-specific recombinase XerD